MSIIKKIKRKYEKYKMANSPSCVCNQNSKIVECFILDTLFQFNQIEQEIESKES